MKKRWKVRKSGFQEPAPKAQGECHRLRESAGGPGRVPEVQKERRRRRERRPNESGEGREIARVSWSRGKSQSGRVGRRKMR